MRPFVAELSKLSPTFFSVHPNAGLPNEFGEYDESPKEFGSIMGSFMKDGFINVAGGCCGTTPEHIAELVELAKEHEPRVVPDTRKTLTLSGLEPLVVTEDTNFINVGERTNVTGSRKFAKLIKTEQFDQALEVAKTAGRKWGTNHRH